MSIKAQNREKHLVFKMYELYELYIKDFFVVQADVRYVQARDQDGETV